MTRARRQGRTRLRKRDRVRKALSRRARAVERVMVDVFGLAQGLPAAEVQVPHLEGGVAWRGDQVYPESEFEPDPRTGHFEREGRYRLRNLRWGYDTSGERPAARFRPGEISAGAAAGVSVLFYSFSPHRFAGHPALLFRFPEGSPVRDPASGATSRGLVVSCEARTRAGQNWGFFQAFFGPLPGVTRYPFIMVLGTLEDYLQRAFELYRRRQLTEWPLALAPQEVVALTRSSLDIALTDHREVGYHATRRSCTTSLFDLLNAGLGEDRGHRRRFLEGLVIDPRASTPACIPDLLRRRGLLQAEPIRITPPPTADT